MEDLNIRLFQWIFSFSHQSAFWDSVGVFLAHYMPYLMVAWMILAILSQKGVRRRIALICESFIAVILARALITELLRFLYPHPRPPQLLGIEAFVEQSSYSFPSGHASYLFALAFVFFMIDRRQGILFFVVSLINGIARIYIGVHWPLDILGGIAVGLASGYLVHRLSRPFLEEVTPAPPGTAVVSRHS